MSRTILHVDMNNFFASVECKQAPALRNRPLAVCGSSEERHGIVLAKNDKAKALGISTGEAIWQAKQKCRDLVIVPPHYEAYRKESVAARKIYEQYTDLVEPFGMDECWLDVTGSRRLFGDGKAIADAIRERIKNELRLTVSIGVSFNKVFAKLGSDMKKPDAVTEIPEDAFREKIWELPVSDMLGVGRATARNLGSVGIRTIGDLARWPCESLRYRLGKCGEELWRYANGLDESPVTVRDIEALDKSCGHGITTIRDLTEPAEVFQVMLALSQDIGHRLYTYHKKATGIAIEIRDAALFVKQWQAPLSIPTQSPSVLAKESFSLFNKRYGWERPIRSVTVRAIGLCSLDTPIQFSLFTDAEALRRTESLDCCIESLRSRFGKYAIRNACLLDNAKMPNRAMKNMFPNALSSANLP